MVKTTIVSKFEVASKNRQFSSVSQKDCLIYCWGCVIVAKTTIVGEFEVPMKQCTNLIPFRKTLVFFSVGGRDKVVKTTILGEFKVPRKNRQFSSVKSLSSLAVEDVI